MKIKNLLIIAFVLITNIIYSQEYSNVLDLLVNNKRAEARKLFDKQFNKTKSTNIDLLFLDAIIDEESGQVDFDETFLKSIEKLPNSEFYIAPFINRSMILGEIRDGNCNDLAYKKVDFLANSPKFKNLPIVMYRKAIFERKRMKHNDATNTFNEFGVINQWQFCGVFENLNGSGLNIEYEPETYAKNDKLFDANSNGKVNWYNPKKPQNEVYHMFENEAEYGNGIVYAQTFITANESKNYILKFGSNLGMKIFLNDREIYQNSEIKNTNLDAYQLKIKLEKGVNRLLVKTQIGTGGDYFSVQIKNSDNSIDTSLKYSNAYLPYIISNEKIQEPELIALDFENYFDNLVKSNPNNLLYKIYQFSAYECNNKKEKAFEAIEGLDIKYPKSSLIANCLLRYNTIVGDENEKRAEILKNIETNDIGYYQHSLLKVADQEWVKSASLQELEKYRDRSKDYKQKYAEFLYDFLLTSRKSDIDGIMKKFDELIANSYNNEKLNLLKASFLISIKDDKTKSLALLEEMAKGIENHNVNSLLIERYNEMNQKDKVNEIVAKRIENYPYLNSFRTRYIDILLNENKYEKAIEVINENLAYFPYSFSNLEKLSNVYGLMKNQKEAEKYIRQSLIYNSGNGELRKKLYDISKTPDEIENIEIKDIYNFIKTNKKSKLQSNYGVVTLLDQYIVNVFPEGGKKSKVTYIYEIVAENGIEELKEYSIGSSYDTVLKSEQIKEDGSIVPAEKGDGVLVFKDLKIGDVILIEYERYESSTGRFYKDFNFGNYFNSTYPIVQSLFAVITPENLQYSTNYSNGNVLFETKKLNNKIARIWKQKDVPAIALQENYSYNYSDINNKIDIGTIKSWNEISNWYSDLVTKSLKLDKITKDTFNEIFKNGLANLSQEQKARTIYEYIEKNIKYSSLDFRQSGFVPQKPSKTIVTKLGDCKDVSTLFVAFAELAGLKANLVLVLTNDNGLKSLPLPANDFNHCIAKVEIDNKEYFLELTDKFLPFKALPISLYKANALVISFDKSVKSELINIPFDNALKNSITSTSTVTIDDKSKNFINNDIIVGSNKAYYNELFSSSTTDDVRTKEIEESLNTALKKVVKVNVAKIIKNELFDKSIQFEQQFSISEKPQSVGSLKITDIPFVNKIYTRDIISQESRKYDINYSKYENNSVYDNTLTINIDANKKFIEVPENKNFKFKNHEYSIQFELLTPNSLKIIRKATTPWETITTIEYPEFKKYVESVVEIEEQIIGYK